ncbi:bifunctional serine/threonine-protein kinase/ABC transporter substrate-binding protein [Streptomyces sp. NPDC057877]|uniref:bifunctional serine/threonine-protein kinase/ABC transporter substrate-binding protein n=1 Tax=Streptomyces sp. NPDC057877 TaxID=3346269 RepID=UPI0036AC5506
MERLVPGDPSRLGGHRLLGRLGAGGMGVVYLARVAEGGDLAAVKAIQPEYADQPEFRARFRREAESARRVDSPWVVPVLGADTEADVPWLATAFVPGPSLGEAVMACGPLPARAVRVLGKVLARALAAVHEAELVHRDVKPGNVLLAPDGPRLIDFGIARPTAVEETALTSDSLVVGTPGFLSPEQARGQRVGPASDVFSLACVLLYAATGQPPFGTGAVDALLYRTVHDEPELDGVADDELRALLLRCLAKDPEARPTVEEVDAALVEDAPEGSLAWLPDAVVEMVAERSAEMLALPGVEPTLVPEESKESKEPMGRRRVLLLGAGGAALLAAGGGAGLWAALRGGDEDTPADQAWTIGLQADLSGPQREIGRAQERAVRLAVEQFNSDDDKPFTLDLRVVDDRGDAVRARRVARQLTGDRQLLAALGPTGYTSTVAALEIYEAAGVPLVTVSEVSTNAAIATLTQPQRYFQAAPVVAYASFTTVAVLGTQGSFRPGLLVDRAGGVIGMEHSLITQSAAKGMRLNLYSRVVPSAATDATAVVDDMLAHDIDGFYYTGTPERGAAIARTLAERGFTGPRFLDMSAATESFTAAADTAADGWQVLTPYIEPKAKSVRAFATAHRERYGSAPGIWGAEAYDATRLVVSRLTALAGTHGKRPNRAQIADAITKARYKGLTGIYTFTHNRLKPTTVHHYRVDGGRFAYVGPVAVPE